MIVKRAKLNLWERLYLSAIVGGFKVTLRHFFKKKVTMQYPEEKWVVPEGYRGAPYLVKDQDDRVKCVSCQLCEFVCPPKAIRITPPGPPGTPEVGNVEKAPKEFEINMLRCIFCGYCQEVCPEEAIFLMHSSFVIRHSSFKPHAGLPLLSIRGAHSPLRLPRRYQSFQPQSGHQRHVPRSDHRLTGRNLHFTRCLFSGCRSSPGLCRRS